MRKSIEVVLPTENGLHARPATKFVEVATEVIQAVQDTGPAAYLTKKRAEVA